MLKHALGFNVMTPNATAIRKRAVKARRKRASQQGKRATTTYPPSKVWEAIQLWCDRVDHNYDKLTQREKMVGAMFCFRHFTALRPQDIVKLHIENFQYEGGENFSTASQLKFRVHNPKDSYGSNMNNSDRMLNEQSLGEFSTIMIFNRPPTIPGRPDVFKFLAAWHKTRASFPPVCYDTRKNANGKDRKEQPLKVYGNFTEDRDGSTGEGDEQHLCTPYFVYKRNNRSHEYTRGAASKMMKALLTTTGARSTTSAITGHHIRHTSLSIVHRFLPEKFHAHMQNARQSTDKTFLANYKLRIDDVTVEKITEAIKHGATTSTQHLRRLGLECFNS